MAAFTSRSTTRPCGPEPLTAARSRPASLAMRRASGEEKTRSPDREPSARSRARRQERLRGAACEPEGSRSAFGAGAAAGAAAALASSPSPAMTAIGVLTATSCEPSGTRIFASTPSSTASTSIVALSVSISAMTSPDLIASPSFLSHLARLPFSIVGERAGMRMLVGMVGLNSSLTSCRNRSGATIRRRTCP